MHFRARWAGRFFIALLFLGVSVGPLGAQTIDGWSSLIGPDGDFPFLGTLDVSSGATVIMGDGETVTSYSMPVNLICDEGVSMQFYLDSSTLAVSTFTLDGGSLTLHNTQLLLADLASTLQPIANGTRFTLMRYNGEETGEFAVNGTPIPEGGIFEFDNTEFVLNYAMGDPEVVMTAVPEPNIWVLMGGAIGLLPFRRRLRLVVG